jgi:methylmalonyl-CoA mutase cobalamin-binding subunit
MIFKKIEMLVINQPASAFNQPSMIAEMAIEMDSDFIVVAVPSGWN